MKRITTYAIASIIGLSLLTGCSTAAATPKANTNQTETSMETKANSKQTEASTKSTSKTSSASYSDAYKSLVSLKTKDYEKLTVSEFNKSLTPDNGDLSKLLENHSVVKDEIPEDDSNYDFIMITLSASLDELYCEQLGDENTFFCRLKRVGNPIKPLNDDEKGLLKDDPIYDFFFSADCVINYKITDDRLTVEERDNLLSTINKTLQSYVDTLDKSTFTQENLSDLLSQKTKEILQKLNNKKLETTFVINNIATSTNDQERES